ncbi:hypothetical protein ACFL96_07690 [Thermoproteota archaeon]
MVTRNRRNKKAQAAMEFIMTYGWALMAIIVIFGALYYFGVRDAERLTPDQCVFLSGLNCLDMNVGETDNVTFPTTISFVVRNEFGFDISNISIWINGTCDSVMNSTGEIAKTALLNKEHTTYGFGCTEDLIGVDINEKISFDFTNTQTGNTHRKVGYIILKQ